MRLVFRKGLRIARGKFRDLPERLPLIAPEEKMPSIRINRKERRILRRHAIAETFELQLTHHALLQQADKISAGRIAIARPDLLCDRAPADLLRALLHQYAAPLARQVCRRHLAIVPAADDDRVI